MTVEHRPESVPTAIKKTPAMLRIEKLHDDRPIEKIVYDLYWLQKKSIIEVGSELGKTPLTLRGWMDTFGIRVRSKSESLVAYYKTHPEGRRYRERGSTKEKFFQTRYKYVIDALGEGSVEKFRERLTEIYRQAGSLAKTSRTINGLGITINPDVVKDLLKELGIEDNISYTKSLIQEAVENGDFLKLTDKQREALEVRFLKSEKARTFRECQKELKDITYQAVQVRNNGGLRKLKELKRARAYKKDVQEGMSVRKGIIFENRSSENTISC